MSAEKVWRDEVLRALETPIAEVDREDLPILLYRLPATEESYRVSFVSAERARVFLAFPSVVLFRPPPYDMGLVGHLKQTLERAIDQAKLILDVVGDLKPKPAEDRCGRCGRKTTMAPTCLVCRPWNVNP